MGIKEKAMAARKLKAEYTHLYDNDRNKEARIKELEYLEARREVLSLVDEDINRQRSVPIEVIKKRVAQMEKPKRVSTGINKLDAELVTDRMKEENSNSMGGMALGNFVQIAGSRGSGKTSIMMKMLTGFSHYETVCWFDFEMGERRVVEKLEQFTHNESNLLYYSASRDLKDVRDEIKLLAASGVNHFVIDSAMKIRVESSDRYDKFSVISGTMAELTSSLGINIYMINQISQSAEREGFMAIKHGNDAEYDADFIFYVLMPKLIEDGRNVKDEMGMDVFDESKRILKCTKNRQDERLFSIELLKEDIIKDNQ
jgi:hypothetical protein